VTSWSCDELTGSRTYHSHTTRRISVQQQKQQKQQQRQQQQQIQPALINGRNALHRYKLADRSAENSLALCGVAAGPCGNRV